MDRARQVIERISSPGSLSQMTSYDVAHSRHVIGRISNPRFCLNPRFLSQITSYDVASNFAMSSDALRTLVF